GPCWAWRTCRAGVTLRPLGSHRADGAGGTGATGGSIFASGSDRPARAGLAGWAGAPLGAARAGWPFVAALAQDDLRRARVGRLLHGRRTDGPLAVGLQARVRLVEAGLQGFNLRGLPCALGCA